MRDKYVVLKYLRLSREDGDNAESDSIANQRNLIDSYVKNELSDKQIETIELADDGYTGTNMNRPGMKKLLILAETQSINCIIVKDFSRFARDYVEVGKYIEKLFPEWEIRFISINDKYDSDDYRGITGGIDVALKNITYALYSIDLSEKVKSAKRIQYKMGKFLAPYAFYGYKKNPDEKGSIIIDEPAAEVVRRIFNMRLSGAVTAQIAKQLNSEGVLTPAEYKKSVDPLCREWNSVSGYRHWTASIITNIIRDERYTGKLISCKHERVAVGSTKVKSVKPEERIVVENAHESIISKEVFEAVRAIVRKKTRTSSYKFGLQNLVRCGGCKHKMDLYGKKSQNIHYCCRYKNFTEETNCFCGKMPEKELAEVVAEAIKTELVKAADMGRAENKIDNAVEQTVKKAEALSRKIAEQKKCKTEEYIRLTKNQITEEEFVRRRDTINSAITDYEQQIEQLRHETASVQELSLTGLFDKYIGVTELNQEIVEDLIKAVYVYPDKRIEIMWNFRDKEY